MTSLYIIGDITIPAPVVSELINNQSTTRKVEGLTLLAHGTGMASQCQLYRNGEMVKNPSLDGLQDLTSVHGRYGYLPAQLGDVIKRRGFHYSHTVTQEDLDRGYVEYDRLFGRYGWLVCPIFLVPRVFRRRANQNQPSISAWTY